MKKNIYKKFFKMLKSKGVLVFSSAFLLVSCGVYTGEYSETDGVYYDPNKDTLPENIAGGDGNQIGEYYDYQSKDYPIDQDDRVYDRYKDWNRKNENIQTQYPASDWGDYTGSVTNYYDSGWYGGYCYWGYPWYGFGFGWGFPYGWYSGYNPYWDYGWGWGNPYYTWYGYPYSTWYGYPYYWGIGYYNNYWGPYYVYNVPRFINRRSGVNGRFGIPKVRSSSNSGFRNFSTPRLGSNSGFRGYNSSGSRNAVVPRTFNRTREVYRSQRTHYGTQRNDGGGFRSSSHSLGGFRSGGGSISFGGSHSSGFRR